MDLCETYVPMILCGEVNFFKKDKQHNYIHLVRLKSCLCGSNGFFGYILNE